ncbi:MAG: hypothetical protein PHU25_20045 [Deltaproteobacteria bacterium]|nr:hypothetical protein [Deltaproteobacteria bacterium]
METRSSRLANDLLALALLATTGLPACGPSLAQQDAQQDTPQHEQQQVQPSCAQKCESTYMSCLESSTCMDGAGQKVPCEDDCRGRQQECEQACPGN